MASVKAFRNPSGDTVYRVQYRINRKPTTTTFRDPNAADRFGKLIDRFGPEEALRQLNVESHNRSLVTFEEWTRHYLDPTSGLLTGIDSRTRDDYQRIAEQALYPQLGAYPIDGIDKAAIGRWLSWQESQHSLRRPDRLVAAKTVKNHHSILSSILNAAVREGQRADNPAYRLKLSRGTPEEPVFLSFDEYHAVYDAILDKWKPLVAFLVGSQLRWSEAAALNWTDLNRMTTPPTVRVSKAWKRRRGGPDEIGPPKSPAAKRTVALWTDLIEELGTPGRGLLFQKDDGTRIPSRTFAGAWGRAIKKSGIEQHPRIHDLRHTGASWLIADGVPLPFIQQRLGHESITTTVGVYGHLLPDAHTRMADSLQGTMARRVQAKEISASTDTLGVGRE